MILGWLFWLSFHNGVSPILSYAMRAENNFSIFQNHAFLWDKILYLSKEPKWSVQGWGAPSKHWLGSPFASCKKEKEQTCNNTPWRPFGIWAWLNAEHMKSPVWKPTLGERPLASKHCPNTLHKANKLLKSWPRTPEATQIPTLGIWLLLIQFPSWTDVGYREYPNQGSSDPQSFLLYLSCSCIYTKVWTALNHSHSERSWTLKSNPSFPTWKASFGPRISQKSFRFIWNPGFLHNMAFCFFFFLFSPLPVQPTSKLRH